MDHVTPSVDMSGHPDLVTSTLTTIAAMDYSNITSNKTSEELLESYLGQRYRSMAEAIILTIVYTLIFITGVFGNVSTCVVIIKNNYMHTATNYYLFSLAISDVMTLLLGLPPELYTIWEAYPWRLGTPYCLFKTFLTEMTSSASILTIAAFTVERYVAICHPIKAQTMSSLSRAIRIIICVWIFAALAALPYPIHTRTYYYVVDPNTEEPLTDSFICNIGPDWLQRMRFFFQLSTFLLFIVPMGLILSLYVLIGITLRRSGLARQTSDGHGSPPHSQSRRAVLKMLVAVVVAFFICWAPFHAQRLMTVYINDEGWTPTLLETQSVLFYISGVLFFVSSTVNPILYNLMSKKYRQAFKDTLLRCCCRTVQGGRSNMWTRSAYERSLTGETYAHGNSGRSAAGRFTARHFPAQKSPLVPKTTSPRTYSDTSEDEFRPHKGNNGFRQCKISWGDKLKPEREPEARTQQNSNRNGDDRAQLNGNVFSDVSVSGSQGSSSPTVMAAHISEELEMARIT